MKIKLLSGVFLACRRIASASLLFLSIVLAVFFVCAAFYAPAKLFSIPLAACGCFLSGWIFGIFLRKVSGLGSKDGDARRALGEQLAENDRLKNECAELRAGKKRLEGQRIDINVLSPVFKLGLVEADMAVKDVKIEWMDDFDKASWYEISPDTRSQYVGILQKSFKTTYGVDLKRVLIHEDSDCLRVAGVEPVLIGHKDDKTEWLLRQVQEYPLQVIDEDKTPKDPLPDMDYGSGFTRDNKYYGINTKKPFEGILDMNLICPRSERQEKELQERINNGMDGVSPFVNNYVREMAKGFIRIFLAPAQKPIEFVSTPIAEVEGDPKWLGLEDFAQKYNKRLDMQTPALVDSSADVCP